MFWYFFWSSKYALHLYIRLGFIVSVAVQCFKQYANFYDKFVYSIYRSKCQQYFPFSPYICDIYSLICEKCDDFYNGTTTCELRTRRIALTANNSESGIEIIPCNKHFHECSNNTCIFFSLYKLYTDNDLLWVKRSRIS